MDDNKRFKKINGYVFDKYIFRVVVIVLLVFLSVLVFVNGYESKFYYNCPGPLSCDVSEYYNFFCLEKGSKLDLLTNKALYEFVYSSGVCSQDAFNIKLLPPGYTYGVKPKGFFYGAQFFTVFLIVAGGFVLNHFKHNKGFKGVDL